jgi:S-methylmethionine-dependent homocysteine/selenocysteine methylase
MPKTILLDGGTGRELKRRGIDVPSTIWSAQALMTAPSAVRDVHADYIRAGADVITTNNYTCTRDILGSVGLAGRLSELTVLARDIANEARAEWGQSGVRIAGSLPPLISSYRPDLVHPETVMRAAYDEIAGLLAPGVDLFLCETMATAVEARIAAMAALATGKPVWVSFTLEDSTYNGRLRSGESVAEALAALDGLAIDAVLFNCTPPEAIDVALPEIRACAGGKIGAYANAFLPVPKQWVMASDGLNPTRPELDAARYGQFAAGWLKDGIDIVGGCCGIGPEHIRRLRDLIDGA